MVDNTPEAYRQFAEGFLRERYPGRIKAVRLAKDFPTDCFQIVVEATDSRIFMHPRFATAEEVENRYIPDCQERLISTMEGNPRTKFQKHYMAPADFSLNELEEAERMVNECQSQ